jgi:hypothetical protein
MYALREFAEYTFVDHYRQQYQLTNNPYKYYEPAYRYGYDLALGYRYRNRGWSALEPDARRDWERRYPHRKWDDFKDAIHYAWDRVRQSSCRPPVELE